MDLKFKSPSLTEGDFLIKHYILLCSYLKESVNSCVNKDCAYTDFLLLVESAGTIFAPVPVVHRYIYDATNNRYLRSTSSLTFYIID
ncbi:hypothetical protein D1B32_01845 [Oceanobacillus profundus]|uniref:Uncharacterized protein n=1 Tax=Oceanobacillus profundus TaxID=372463 RepID=A0A417YNT0_9BACI|nr:hypothetical protein CHI07_03090 [Paenibacillus sp. 7884-2]RHW35386.1 hypothetical protein D1B32_01845 [Oceanobacillus profundus]